MNRVTANGIDFAYLEAGPSSGPLALCLHGFPDIPRTFGGLLPHLADAGFHAVAPFMRGYAPTTPAPNGSYHVADLALDAIELTDALGGGDDTVLIGHDWGAVATWTAAGYQPERFRRIVALAVAPASVLAGYMLQPEIIRNAWYQWFFQMPIAESVVAMDDFRFIDVLWSLWSPGFTPDPDHLREVKRCLGTQGTLGAEGTLEAAIGYYRSTLGSAWSPPSEELEPVQGAMVSVVMTPALYLHGSQDGIYPAEIVSDEELRAFVPEIEREIVEGAGHFLHLERPDVVVPRIVGFVSA